MRTSETATIGLDLGGNTMSAGLVEGGDIITYAAADTGRSRAPDDIVADMLALIESVAGSHTPGAIGIGVPIPAGPRTEAFMPPSNLPALHGYPLKDRLAEHFTVPVVLENDANCMTVGEYHAGALRGISSGACLTLGTGLGCGIIVDGSLFRGARYSTGEIWNLPAGDVLLEDTVSIDRLTALAKEHLQAGLTPRDLYERWSAGDAGAREVWRRYGEAVGGVVLFVLTLLDPERIVIGGGISGAFGAFREAMTAVIEPYCGEDADGLVRPALLSDRAAIIGAAMLAKENAVTVGDGRRPL